MAFTKCEFLLCGYMIDLLSFTIVVADFHHVLTGAYITNPSIKGSLTTVVQFTKTLFILCKIFATTLAFVCH